MSQYSVSRASARPGTAAAAAEPEKSLTKIGFILLASLVLVAVAVAGCSRKSKVVDESNKLSKRVVSYGQPVPKGGGRYKVGKPYKIAGRWYKPKEDPSYDRVGIGSWYGDLFHGRYTANGEVFDMDALTAAHPTLPLPSYVRVTNLKNSRSLVLRVNDRGPYAHDRIIDLSRASAHALGYGRAGTAKVRVQYLGPAPLNGDDSLERRVYASQPWARRHASFTPKNKTGPRSRTQLAQAAQKAVQADQIVVGSIPKPATVGKPGSEWQVNTIRPLTARKIGGNHFVQAASFNNRNFADKLSESFSDLGPVKVLPKQSGGKTWYRVRVGPFVKRHDADEVLRSVVESGMTDARIVRN